MIPNHDSNRLWTWVSEDGKHAAAGMSLGQANANPGATMKIGAGMKTGAGGDPQPYDDHGRYLETGTLHAANTRVKTATDAGKAPRRSPLGVGVERGTKGVKYYVLPPAVKTENERIALVYSQKDGTLMDMEDRLVGKGYSGAPGHVNVPESQGKKDQGVIPQGTWTIGEVIWNKNETHGKGENLIHLVPDHSTAERVRAMGRDPNTFYIHAGKITGERTASQGCIIISVREERKAIRELQGAKIRVVR